VSCLGPSRPFAGRPLRVATLSHKTMDSRKKAATIQPSPAGRIVAWSRRSLSATSTIVTDRLRNGHVAERRDNRAPTPNVSGLRCASCIFRSIPLSLFESPRGRDFPASPQSLFSYPLRLTEPRSPKSPYISSRGDVCVATFGKVRLRRSPIRCVDFQLLATGVGPFNWHTLAQRGERKGQWTAFWRQPSGTKHRNALMLFWFSRPLEFLTCGLSASRSHRSANVCVSRERERGAGTNSRALGTASYLAFVSCCLWPSKSNWTLAVGREFVMMWKQMTITMWRCAASHNLKVAAARSVCHFRLHYSLRV
jgi:hypothetical protein